VEAATLTRAGHHDAILQNVCSRPIADISQRSVAADRRDPTAIVQHDVDPPGVEVSCYYLSRHNPTKVPLVSHTLLYDIACRLICVPAYERTQRLCAAGIGMRGLSYQAPPALRQLATKSAALSSAMGRKASTCVMRHIMRRKRQRLVNGRSKSKASFR
jgi:hypothetical protein